MGYKKYSDYSSAEEMVAYIKRGGISNRNTAYRELLTITKEWPRTNAADDAEYLIDTEYVDQKYS